MKLSFRHIKDRITEEITIDEISEKLFQLGHENVIENEIIDIEITPNRGDCLSLLGILRELSVFYDVDKEFNLYSGDIDKFDIDFENLAPETCQEISFLYLDIENEIKDFSNDVQSYFNDLGINNNNFFTDISNYVSYEIGQPTHCYDYKYVDNKITFTLLEEDAKFRTLMGNEINLTDRNPVFLIGEKVANLAGVMGGEDSACSSKTRSVIVECAYFNPEEIIGQALKYDVQSEAAYKFERGVDKNIQEFALKRFLQIVRDHATVKNIKLFQKKYTETKSTEISFDVDKINEILGLDIDKETYSMHLNSIGFDIHDDLIKIPSYRNDIETQNDLAEEIARIVGYQSIPRQEINLPKKTISYDMVFENAVKLFLNKYNFNEVINFPFVEVKHKKSIKIDNPLDSSKKYLRSDLQSSLIANLLYNERRQKDSLKLFEISDIYDFNDDFKRKRVLGIIASGRVGKNYKDFSTKINENYLEDILRNVVRDEDLKIINVSRESLETKLKDRIFYFEIEIQKINLQFESKAKIFDVNREFISYSPISDFPRSVRDLSFSIKNFSNYDKLIIEISNFKSKILKEAFLFDFYKNNKADEIKIGYRFIFQSNTKTLTDIEITQDIEKIIKIANGFDGVSIPGYSN